MNPTMKGYQAQADLYSDLYRSYFLPGPKCWCYVIPGAIRPPHLQSSSLSSLLLSVSEEEKKQKTTKWQRLNTGSGGTFLRSPEHEAKS